MGDRTEDMRATSDKGPDASPVPFYIVERFRAWRATRFASDRSWYARLAEDGQNPRAMIIACCDSRVDVQSLLGAEPGEIFKVRNVANLVPPYAPDHEHHGTSAAIEYAVTVLKVSHILVIGHANCGGVASYLDRCERAERGDEVASGAPFLDRWMDILGPARARLAADAAAPGDRKQRLRALEQEAVLTSLRNLETFPFVVKAMAAGRLTIHGAWFDIASGDLHGFSPADSAFHPL